MFHKIMVPVDLAHLGALDRALEIAGTLAKSSEATVCYVGVTAETPTALAHNPAEYGEKLAGFAADQAARHGIDTESLAKASHDPAIDMNGTLLRAIDETGADLVVMQSHVPTLADHLWPSHGGLVASRAKVSVLVVR